MFSVQVAAGAIAEKWLQERYGTRIVAWVSQVHEVRASTALENDASLTRAQVDSSLVRCPDKEVAPSMQKVIEKAKAEHDSVGGVVTCVVRNVPAALGEPCFDKLEARLAHAMLSIPATKGFEIGSGFAGVTLKGSQHNDMFVSAPSSSSAVAMLSTSQRSLATKTNNSGGIQGGISNGMDIVFRIAFKPPATIGQAQDTVDFTGFNVTALQSLSHVECCGCRAGSASTLAAKGRHDPCVVPRALPIVEAMAALVIADCALIQESRTSASLKYPVMGKVGHKRKGVAKPAANSITPQSSSAPDNTNSAKRGKH